MKLNEHEIQYRAQKQFEKMRRARIFVCGAGALGSNLVNNLVRQGVSNLVVIDMDRVEHKNVSTQLYTLRDVGQKKANALKSLMYQATKQTINVVDKELQQGNVAKLIKGHDLVVDVFDNWESRGLVRRACERLSIPCVHAGMSDDGFAEIKWNEIYKIPAIETKQDDICDYPLAANLVHLTVGILAEVIVQFVISGNKANREITLKDIGVHNV